jgi:phosphoglycerate dehydrogenase-like enzyme
LALRQLLAKGGVIVFSPSLTDDTEGMIGVAALPAISRPRISVNIGRGKLIDDTALRTAWIGGAGLNVQTPVPANNASFDLPNVILTAHMSGVAQAYCDRSLALLLENVRWYIAGESLVNVVDKGREF